MSLYPETQESLIALLGRGGNQLAWEKFSELYRPVFYRLARSGGLQDADAQDVVQQVLLSIARSIGHWHKKESDVRFRGWLHRIARNALLNTLTRQPKDRPVGGSSANFSLANQVDVNGLSEHEFEAEYRRALYQRAAKVARHEFEQSSWQAFELCAVSSQSPEAVARQLGKSLGSVYAAKSRVMRRLRELVKKYEELEHEFSDC